MNPEEAFHEAILESPDDDSPRLVYADWLQEHGDDAAAAARAEFIRLQIEHARLDEDDYWRRQDFRRREEALVAEHGAAWRAELPAWTRCETCWFRRGFVALVSASAVQFSHEGAELRRCVPLEGVRLRGLAHYWGIPKGPEFAGLRLLNLSHEDDDELLSPSDVCALANSPQLGNLEVLSLALQEWISDGGLRGVARGGWPQRENEPRLESLRELYLGCCHITAVGLEELANSPHRDRLTTLDVYGNRIGARGASLLRAFPNLAALQASNLGAGVSTLMSSPHLRSLRSLWLEMPSHKQMGVEALAACPYLSGLRALELTSNRLDDRAAFLLAGSPHLSNLTHLDLFDNAITDAGAEALAHSPHLSQLVTLNLRANRIGDSGARALALSPCLTNLRALDLNQNEVESAAAAVLRERFGDNVHFLILACSLREQERWGIASGPLQDQPSG
jgi:uncharacterized protein (TIGR02996 family)